MLALPTPLGGGSLSALRRFLNAKHDDAWTLLVAWLVQALRHRGLGTPGRWSDLALLRTTPALLVLFSLVTLMAHWQLQEQPLPTLQAAWYTRPLPTFVDALALVRRLLWPLALFGTSATASDSVTIPRSLVERLTDALAYAA